MSGVSDLNPFDLEPERYELHVPPEFGFVIDRRDFLRTIGGGLVVLCLLRPTPAQESGGRGRRRSGEPPPREIGAWLHIGADGTATAYTGKVEVGQGIRTSLAQAVADELRLSVESVQLVMGDTTRVPFDMGTFGSRTTPSMAPQLRRAAAAARSVLLGLAADRMGAERTDLEAREGRIVHRATGQSVAYGELTEGRRLVEAIEEDTTPAPADHWEVAGRPAPQEGGRGIVTGRHTYASDVTRPGMLRGKVLRPPAAAVGLRTLDATAAERLPGVAVVRDGDFIGVAAPNESAAAAALAALKAEWETPPRGLSDADLAAHLRQHVEGETAPADPDLEAALAAADVRVEASYTIAPIAHAPLEPRAAVAEWEKDRLTVWTATQRPFGVRSELARAFGLAEDRVRVIVPDSGGAYGGKHTGEAAIEAARLARAAGRPVKLTWTRPEEFAWAYCRPPGVIDLRAGAKRDGTLIAWEFVNINSGGAGLASPYTVAHRRERFRPSQSPLRQGSYRALASTANHFARESAIDDLAAALELDPLAFRLKNLSDPRLRAVFEAAADRFGWGRARTANGRGVGLAGGTEKGGFVATCAEVEMDGDTPRVVRLVAAFECGAIVNPDGLRNQVEGSLVMGLGGALFEAIRFADGVVLNGRFSRYRLPRFRDLPVIEVVLLDRKDLPSAGAGEAPIVAVAPAIGNAIRDATGVRRRSLPLMPIA